MLEKTGHSRPEGSMYRSECLQLWFVKAFTPYALKAALEDHCHEECATGWALLAGDDKGLNLYFRRSQFMLRP